MKTEADWPEETVWTRIRDEPVLDVQVSDERPNYLAWAWHIALVIGCIVLMVVWIDLAFL